ncbi:hypothetical protein ASPZODRAFT_59825 [Penicilliopsis zonata CBS 506.65]|uniref:Nonsense-mediated mRNA decay factor n=1 Tax=Penicilliopsis zonata CBS 506.65 TaxID=1073090 RepID=A0A1L9SP05_9EURO|nr:hypothetical protein ASPZODRAFT_59825 [Penicilliopsis zonata CBS 506.65]OJJ48856.1 hypothetical protein ASPZODRAFT_59825 [Penicilliopsis zonata CBS 506.65]
MASAFQNAWQNALEAEKQLLKSLAEKESTFADITQFLSEFRSACLNTILLDFERARSADLEPRLWDAHLKINTRFRKRLARFREENGKKKPVEKRKLEKHYLVFIKSSQKFYRGYIQSLSSHFEGIEELDKVTRKFNFESSSAQSAVQVSDNLRKLILLSCHATLIRLGDLSRYRETELVSKDRNWGPAIGYYDLAVVIYPASGASHNQLAVIALADGNHLRATYHLYRALAALEPHPSAKGNLEIEFRKVMNLWAKRELIRPEDAGIPGRALAPWFVYLHAQCYKGADFPEHDELENEVLSQLAVDLKERSLEGTLQKFCLVNIAAEDLARARSDDESAQNSRYFFQRINLKTFFTLLQILLAELERFAVEDLANKDAKTSPDKVTVVARRILPALRNYSSWLLTVNNLLVAQKEEKDSPLFVQIQEFWKIYANTLTLLASSFDVVHLPEVDYLLEEDEETLGFRPLAKECTARRYLDTSGRQKPRVNDLGVERSHPNIEMLYRIREFVIDGLDLVVSSKIPIALVDDNDKKIFIYQEEGLPSQFFASPQGHHHTLSSASIEREDIQHVSQDLSHTVDARSIFGDSQSASASVAANMTRIVEGVERLVDSDTYESAPPVVESLVPMKSNGPPTPPGHLFEPGTRISYHEDGMRDLATPIAPPPGLGLPMTKSLTGVSASSQSYTPRPTIPSVPSIWNRVPSQLGDVPSPRTPPGLGQQNMSNLMMSGDGSAFPPQNNMITPETMYRHHSAGHIQSSIDGLGMSASPWTSSNPSSSLHLRPGAGWERDPRSATALYFDPTNQQYAPSNLTSSWANDAFIGSSLSPGLGYHHSSGFGSNRRSAAQLGAIGQTPPCGQGG